jgi:hypothetical protein
MLKRLRSIICPTFWALNSAVECHLHTVEVTGSSPVAPTIPHLAQLAALSFRKLPGISILDKIELI